jgi:SAM-dependent methyltransferase
MSDIEADTESARLRLLERCRDPGTTRRLEALGVTNGWRCLEVGAGRGSIVRWLAERVGGDGSVVACDLDPRFLTDVPGNVEVRTLDIREQDVEPGKYDLVHCRALLMHLPDPAAALGRMAKALRPGGLLLAEEGDYGLVHYGGHVDAASANDLAHRLLEALRASGTMNPWFGRSLPALVTASELELVGAEVETPVARPGDPHFEFACRTMMASAPGFVAAGILGVEEKAAAERYFEDPNAVITMGSVISAWGRKQS